MSPDRGAANEDGQFINLYCPECCAKPRSVERYRERDGWITLTHSYCKVSLNSTVDDEFVPTSIRPSDSFDDRLFATDGGELE